MERRVPLKAGEEKVSMQTAKAHGLDESQSFTVNCVCMVGVVFWQQGEGSSLPSLPSVGEW